jgi:hypothetical protein
MNNYVNNLNSSQVDDTSGGANSGAQLSHVIKDIQNLNMNTNYHYLPNGKHHRGMKNDEILSKDSGVQSNGDLDSGLYLVLKNSFFFLLNESNIQKASL